MNAMSKYLPIARPMEIPPQQDGKWFYDNIVSALLPDIIKMQRTGIPIDLSKVKDLEDTVENVLSDVQSTMLNNPLMQKFREEQSRQLQESRVFDISQKTRTLESFYPKEFTSSNKIHRSYIVNQRLDDLRAFEYMQPEWTLKDLKLLVKVYPDILLEQLANGEESSALKELKKKALQAYAKAKFDIYYKSKVAPKIEAAVNAEADEFNCSSPKQKAAFFEFLGVQSETATSTGSPKWDRDELEKLNKLLDSLIEQEEDNG